VKSITHESPKQKTSTGWPMLAGLLLLSVIPVVAGAFRLTQLAGGPEITSDNARFVASPVPVVLHVVAATVYAILGAFQFSDGLRRRQPGWHRAAGRLLVLCGLVVGLSGLWMTLFYPGPDRANALLVAFRLLFGSAMVASLVLGVTTIRARNVAGHQAWMTRAYAIGLGAGTQALTLMAGELIVGPPDQLSRALLMGAAWVINLVVAERAIRRRRAARSGQTLSAPVVSPCTNVRIVKTNISRSGRDAITYEAISAPGSGIGADFK
jgi:uncharacterized membrane protein